MKDSGTMVDDYGRWAWNLPDPRPNHCGVVIPTCGRPALVRRCLESLAQSNLEGCVICIVDETNAGQAEIEGFRCFLDIDSPLNDLVCLNADLDELARACVSDPRCVAFNSLGWLKRRLVSPKRVVRFLHARAALYVKEEYCNRYPREVAALRQIEMDLVEQKRPASGTEEIVHSFKLPGVAILKVFKHRHGQMFDSLKRGWDLLAGQFGCEYLACLDSDTIVKPDWLEQLFQTHQAAAAETSVVLLTGFNTRNHPTLVEKPYGYVKRSCGGINLFFHRSRYETVVRPALHTIGWDHAVVTNVKLHGGLIVCTKPSVVQHLGKLGLWSDGQTFDHAWDF